MTKELVGGKELKNIILILLTIIAITGCDKDEDPACRTPNANESCPGISSPYTCDGATNCYSSKSACQASNECD